MAYVVGTDEAGYGPNLGPLVIAATVWRVPSLEETPDLYRSLRHAVSADVNEARRSNRVVVADSKHVYRTGSGLSDLELGVLGMVATVTDKHQTWKELCQTLKVRAASQCAWHADFNPALPVDTTKEDIAASCNLIRDTFDRTGVSLVGIRATAVFPSDFNERVTELGTKGTLLSEETIRLVRDVTHAFDRPTLVQCDKHGGRNRYAAVLQQFFPDSLPRVCFESRAESRYRIDSEKAPREFRFCAKGERYLPSALASMTAKYLREIAMRAFNNFWRMHVPNLKPTAGYPVDAKRFKRDIASAQRKLGISDNVLWRQC